MINFNRLIDTCINKTIPGKYSNYTNSTGYYITLGKEN